MFTIRDAEAAIRDRFKAEGANIPLEYDAAKVVETERWWYIPCRWIGCSGQIVDKLDLRVNWLGSALSLDDCFWGHDRGIVCAPIDFTFTDEVPADADTILRIVMQLKRCTPRKSSFDYDDVWYSTAEAQLSIERHFPTFRYHLAWLGIREIRAASEARLFSFCAGKTDA